MKKIIKLIFVRISRFIWIIFTALYWIVPAEIRASISKRNSPLEKKLSENLMNETLNNFKEHFKKSVLFKDVLKMREYAIKTSLLNDINKENYYLEFGVWKGESTNTISKYVKQLYAFDSFEGLREDWSGTEFEKSVLSLNKKIPKLNSNVQPIVGWIEDTLDDFLKKHNPKINFVHLDMDTYTPTKFILDRIKPYLVKDAIIIFDELYNYIGWEHGEYKALKEVFKENEFQYKAFNTLTSQVVIQIK